MSALLIKSYTASGAVGERRAVRLVAAGQVAQAAGSADNAIGVCVQPGGAVGGQRVDVVVQGIVDIDAGAAFAAGGDITVDASGRAIAAAPQVGQNVEVLGVALDSASAAGDIVPVLLAQSALQGALRTFTVGGAAVTANRIVAPNAGAGEVIQASSATSLSIGVALNAGAPGQPVAVLSRGEALVTSGAAITAGALLTSDSTGRAVPAAPGAGATARIIGVALAATAAANNLIPVAIGPSEMRG